MWATEVQCGPQKCIVGHRSAVSYVHMSPPCLLTTYLHTYPPMYTHVTSMPTHHLPTYIPTYVYTRHLHAYSPPTYIHTHLCIHTSPPCLLTTYLHTYPPMYTHWHWSIIESEYHNLSTCSTLGSETLLWLVKTLLWPTKARTSLHFCGPHFTSVAHTALLWPTRHFCGPGYVCR